MEAYDHAADTWSNMPSMIRDRAEHSLVAVRNKLYVFGGGTAEFEVYDSLNEHFSILEPPALLLNINHSEINNAFSFGNKVFILKNRSATLTTFDYVNQEWKEEPYECTEYIESYGCLKLPKN